MKRFKILLLVLLTTLTVSLVAVGVITGLEKQSSEVPPTLNDNQNTNTGNNDTINPDDTSSLIAFETIWLDVSKKFTLKNHENVRYKINIPLVKGQVVISSCRVVVTASETLQLKVNDSNIESEDNQFKVRLKNEDELCIFGGTLEEQIVEICVVPTIELEDIGIEADQCYLVAFNNSKSSAFNFVLTSKDCLLLDVCTYEVEESSGEYSFKSHLAISSDYAVQRVEPLIYSSLLKEGRYYLIIKNTSNSYAETALERMPVEELILGENIITQIERGTTFFYKFEAKERGCYTITFECGGEVLTMGIYDNNTEAISRISSEKGNFCENILGTHWLAFKENQECMKDGCQHKINIKKEIDDYYWVLNGDVMYEQSLVLEKGNSYEIEFWSNGVKLDVKMVNNVAGVKLSDGILKIDSNASVGEEILKLSPPFFLNSLGYQPRLKITIT